jgi:toxin ParE1/3/4
MRIVFTVGAKRDLDDLRAYLAPLAPAGLANVVAALEAKILDVADNPGIGRPSPRPGVREAVETSYGFVIPYFLKDETLFVLRIYRSHRRPLDYATLDLP